MLAREGREIVVTSDADKKLCDMAAKFGSGETELIINLQKVEKPIPIGAAATELVMRGLASLSLLPEGYEVNGYTPGYAKEQFELLGGEDVICPDPEFFTEN